MFDEPTEDPSEPPIDPVTRAREKADEFRMHAELCAVFEGCRKFAAELRPGLDARLAREVQRTVGRLEKAKTPESPVLPDAATGDAAVVLSFAAEHDLSTNDYHVYRRPGEVMVVRWLAGEQVDSFYTRLQAHFDAAMNGFREEERQSQAWRRDPKTLAYLEALDKLEVRMAERYLRDVIRQHKLFVLSTQSADELNIAYLTDYIMGVPPADLVGDASAPPDAPTERDLTWFFKLFSLRGVADDGTEQMCLFAYLQKSDDEPW